MASGFKHGAPVIAGMKTCKQCGVSKPVDLYYKQASGRGGIKALCIACCKLRNKARVRDGKVLYQRRRELGLCLTCPNAPVEGKTRCQACADHQAHLRIRYYRKNKRVILARDKQKRIDWKRKVFALLGNKCSCVGCTVTEWQFLQIDHPANTGAAHRRANGPDMLTWLKQHDWDTTGLRLLCANCNWSRGVYGHCAHEVAYARKAA